MEGFCFKAAYVLIGLAAFFLLIGPHFLVLLLLLLAALSVWLASTGRRDGL